MLSRAMMRTDAQPIDALDVRLIGSSKVNLLEKYHGNRNAVAAELGVSTTTLWRRMKKYGIEPNYVN